MTDYAPAAQAADDQDYAHMAADMHATLPEVLKVDRAHGAVAAAAAVAAQFLADEIHPATTPVSLRTVAGVAIVELARAHHRIEFMQAGLAKAHERIARLEAMLAASQLDFANAHADADVHRAKMLELLDTVQLTERLDRDPMKAPCQTCQKPTTLRCGRCGRALCAVHAAWNRRTEHHSGGLYCPDTTDPAGGDR